MIGMGFISQIHLKAFERRKDVEIVAMSDTDQAKLLKTAKQYGVKKTFPDYKYMLLEKEIDVIDIMTPHNLHKEHICSSLLSGKTVICEKPIVTKVADMKDVIKTIKKTKKYVYLKQYLRHSLAWEIFQEKINAGAIGKPYLIQCLFTGNSVKKYDNPHTWRGDIDGEGGGVFIDIAVHMLDRLSIIFGSPKVIYGKTKKVTTKLASKGEDVALAVFEYPSDLTASFSMTQSDPGFGFRWEVRVFGTKGIIELTDRGKISKNVKVIQNNMTTYEYTEEDWWNQSNIRALDSIVELIGKNQQPLIDLQYAENIIKTIDQFYKISGNR